MRATHIRAHLPIALAALFAVILPGRSLAQSQPPDTSTGTQTRPAPTRIGVDAFGGASVSWPAAADSFDASGLESRPTHFGGGARVTSLWRDLFAEVAVSRWSDTGERVFIDSTGERFPLGIPLSVKATYVDMSAGWKVRVVTRTGRISMLPYVGAGAGVVMYKESSPFAETGEDVDSRATSYHAFAGVEVPIVRWLAVGVDGRYRYVPDLLGDEGISEALGDDSLGGMQMGVTLRVAFGGGSPPPAPGPEPTRPFVAPPPPNPPLILEDASTGTILTPAPVYLLPDATRIPLRELTKGTRVRVLEETGDWIRIEFPDPQFGPRVGYVERKFVQIRKQES